jgi:hypothetical protein
MAAPSEEKLISPWLAKMVYPMLPVSLDCPFLIIADDGVKQQVQYNNRTNS